MLQKNFSWARRITCLANQVQSRKAITEFHQLQKSGQKITEFLLSSVVKVCGRVEALQEGKQAHCLILKLGFNADLILMTTLLDMYSKCTNIQEACRVFEEMPQRDVVVTNSMISGLCRCHLPSYAIDLFTKMNESERDVGTWNSLISGLGQNLEGRTALIIFGRMRVEDVELDVMTMMSILSICADMAMMVHAQQVHGLVIKSGFEQYLPVGNAIVDMYAKCGCMDDACLCFQNMPFKNVISWTSLISGYAKHGLGIEALKAFQQMEMEGVVPNKITFLGTLYACSHAGLLQEGWSNFTTMVHKYLITPTMEHYTCMVDLLARAGHLEEAHDFIERMPINPDAKLLTAFLSSCCHHKNVELARTVGQKLLQLQPQEAGAYISLSNFYGLVGDLEGVANVRRLMLERGIRKEKACTWIEISRKVHSFESGDRSHPDYLKICKYLEVLIQKMKNIGYVPDTSMVAQNVDELTKEEILLGHSEKLAIALGLMSTHPGTCILIVKNLRVCADCHVFTGLISKIEGREIVARDTSRFHHFKDGVCSCGNYW